MPPNQSSKTGSPRGGGKKSAIWAMADQGVVSLGNLVTVVLLGRGLATVDFGRFTIILETIFFLNSLQAALVVYPLSVRGASVNVQRLQRFTNSSLVITLIMGFAMGLAMAIAGGMTHQMMPWLLGVFAMIFWQIQETTRRGLMAHMRFRDAIWGDAIAYLLQAVLIAAMVLLPHRLGGAKSQHGSLSLEYVFLVIGGTSIIAATVQLFQIGLRTVTRRMIWRFGTRAWELGRWMVLTNFVGIATGYGYTLLMAATHGDREVALFGALGGLLKFANPLMVGIQGLILPACAQANKHGGVRSAGRIGLRYGALGGGLLLPMFAVLFIFPEQITRLVYNNPDYQHHALAIRIWVIGYSLLYIGNTASAFFNALEQSKVSFIAQTGCSITALFVSLPMTYVMGAFGTILGGMITHITRCAVLFGMLRKVLREGEKSTQSAASTIEAEAIASDTTVTAGAA